MPKIFINHLSRCGGTSIIQYLNQSFDGQIIVVNSRTARNDADLVQMYKAFSNESNVLAIGHTHQPSLPNRELVRSFWREIYRLSDIQVSILRDPIERSLSWLKAAGNLSTGADLDAGIPFRFRGLGPDDTKLVSVIETQRGSRSSLDDSIYDCIMPENFFADMPDNLSIAGSINNYPGELISSKRPLQWFTPLACRSEEHINEFNQMMYGGLSSTTLVEYLSIPQYEFFTLENINNFVSSFESRGYTRPGFTVPQINGTRAAQDISPRRRRTLLNLFPESYLLWKHASGIF